MTSEQTTNRKVESLEYAMFEEGLKRVLRACRGKPACGWLKRGYAHLIESDKQDER
jgi:hypothetical protein